MNADLRQFHQMAQFLFDKKAVNLLGLDISLAGYLNSYILIAEGMSSTHVTAMAEGLVKVMRDHQLEPSYVEGIQLGQWAVIDYLTIAVHIFMPELRQYYQLERIWEKSDLISLQDLR